MTTVGLLARPNLAEARPVLRQLVDWLRARDVATCVEERTAALLEAPSAAGLAVATGREVAARSDVMVVLGGDGTILRASHLIEKPGLPLIGVNFGSLGFLTEVALPELPPVLESVLAGRYHYDERGMLRATLDRGGDSELVGDVLNDVVVTKAATISRIIELDVTVDGRFVSAFRADGLIVSTTTGSTAYNLAAGGPILLPALPAVVLTPICPHMVSHRPLVVGDQSQIRVRLHSRDAEVHVSLDGQRSVPLGAEEVVTLTRSPRTLRLVKVPGREYFEVLRSKLKWGESNAPRRS
jgi:NAD+ kinase